MPEAVRGADGRKESPIDRRLRGAHPRSGPRRSSRRGRPACPSTSAARAGRGVRESVGRAGQRQAEAAAAAGDHLRDWVPDIRVETRDDLRKLSAASSTGSASGSNASERQLARAGTKGHQAPGRRRSPARPPGPGAPRIPGMGRRVLITGVSGYWGTELARRLERSRDFDYIAGLDVRPPGADLERTEFIRADIRNPLITRLLPQTEVDTVVHCDVLLAPEPGKAPQQLHDINVIGSLQLLAACEKTPTVRTIVVRGSAAIYGAEPNAPEFFTEDMARRFPLRTRFQRDIGELESYFENYARRYPEMTVMMLRYQPTLGRAHRLAAHALPAPAGRPDPARLSTRCCSSCTRDDAVGALEAAVRRPVRGPVNVAGEGSISLRRLLRLAGKVPPRCRRRCSAPRSGRRAARPRATPAGGGAVAAPRADDRLHSPDRGGRVPPAHDRGGGPRLREAARGRRALPGRCRGRVRPAAMADPGQRERPEREAGAPSGGTACESASRRRATRPTGRRADARRARTAARRRGLRERPRDARRHLASAARRCASASRGSSCRRPRARRRSRCPARRATCRARGPPHARRLRAGRVGLRRGVRRDRLPAASSSCTTAGGGSRRPGVEHVPGHDRAMLVANHAGVLPWDATMMSVAILKHHPLPRHPRFMVLDWAFRLPWVSAFMRRVGGVVASPFNAMRLLEQGHLVMVFPEGVEGRRQALLRALPPAALRPRRLRRDRAADRRADRPGRRRRLGGDLPEARRVAAAGAADRRARTSRSRRPSPRSACSARSRCRRSGGSSSASRSTSRGYGPEAADDRALVFELSERVRETIQERVLENLVRAARRSSRRNRGQCRLDRTGLTLTAGRGIMRERE